MKMKLTRTKLRKLIRETINTWHKNYYTAYDDTYSYEDYPSVEVDKYINHDGSWSVVIHCEFNPDLSEPMRVFKTEEDASAYSKKKSDEINRIYLNSGNL